MSRDVITAVALDHVVLILLLFLLSTGRGSTAGRILSSLGEEGGDGDSDVTNHSTEMQGGRLQAGACE